MCAMPKQKRKAATAADNLWSRLSNRNVWNLRVPYRVSRFFNLPGRALVTGVKMFDLIKVSASDLMKKVSSRHWHEFARLFRSHKWERDENGGIRLSGAGVIMRGDYRVWAPDGLGWTAGHNLWTTEGFNHLLSVALAGGSQVPTWYVAPTGANVAVVNTLTAATFASAQTELTAQYSQATRVAYAESAPSGGSTSNSASPATITAASNGVNVWGFGILSVPTKGSTSGTLLCATTYSAVRTLPLTGDSHAITHTLTLQNPS